MWVGSLATAAHLVREAGPGWVARRAWLSLAHRLRIDERRTPAQPWSARPLATWLRPGVPSTAEALCAWRRSGHAGRWMADHLPAPADIGAGSVLDADRILAGEWPFFSGQWLPLGFPPPWHRHPLTGREWDASLHWSAVGDASADDIKFLWEPARSGVVFTLARAWRRTGDARYAAAVWTLVDDWIAANPPMLGAQWRCGQETALRLFAWCFGLYVCGGGVADTPDRTARLIVAAGWQAERIEAHIAYARSQKNNHALSEAIGLLTVGTLFPELARAAHWRAMGARILGEELDRQVYADGAFVQHATNYHRVMLQEVAWAVALARRNDVVLGAGVAAALARGLRWLRLVVDPGSGHAPNFGNNDGALILPLADADYGDMRPTLSLAASVIGVPSGLPAGAWDEAAAWFGAASPAPAGASAIATPAVPREAPRVEVAQRGGQAVLRGADAWAMLRCARFVDRPAHADQLHADIWWRGHNVACDAGTYRYSAAPPWDHSLARSAVHNTVTLDGADQMVRVSRFLWTRWAQGTLEGYGATDRMAWARGSHDGYRSRGLEHARTVVVSGDHVIVLDDLRVRTPAPLRLQWLLHGEAALGDITAGTRLRLLTSPGVLSLLVKATIPVEASVASGGTLEEPTRGWRSPTYGIKVPAASLVVEGEGRSAVRFITVLGPDDAEVAIDDACHTVHVRHGHSFRLHLPPGAAPHVDPVP